MTFYTALSLQENLQQWLTDEKARDQFVIRAGSDTEVLWNDARHLKPEPVYKHVVSRSDISLSCYCHLRLFIIYLGGSLSLSLSDSLCACVCEGGG